MEDSAENRIKTKAKNGELQLYELRLKMKQNWHWILISVVICSGIVLLYLEVTPDIYQRTASILIKDETSSNMSELSAFEDLGLPRAGTNVNNEIRAFRSPDLISDVVKRLRLDISYGMRKGVNLVELYAESPVLVSFPEAQDNTYFSFDLELLSHDEYILSGFFPAGEDLHYKVKAHLSDTVLTPVGHILVRPSFFYDEHYPYKPIRITKSRVADVVRDFLSRTTVALSGINTTIINLTVRDESVKRGDDFLNTLISVYNESRMDDKSRVAVNTSDFINKRLGIIEKELRGIDTDIEEYKSLNLLTDVQSAGERFVSESSEYASQAFELNNQLTVAGYIKDHITTQPNAGELLPINSGIDNQNIESQINEYNALLLKRDKLLFNSSNQNPVVTDMNKSLGAMRQSIIHSIDNLIVTLDIQISGMKKRENQMKKRIASNPGQEKYLLTVERQQKIKESLYLYLLQKREENELSKEITICDTRIITAATGSNTPVAPDKRMFLAISLLIGLVIAPSFIWVREMFNSSIRGKNDIISNLSIPYIGDIPRVSKKIIGHADRNLIVAGEQKRDMINDAFRIVISNIEFMRSADEAPKTIMFTSLNPYSGKTFVSINLAMNVAMAGRRVLVIDLDMRKASLSKYFGHQKLGIAAYLRGEINRIDDVIIKSLLHDNLDLLPVGIQPSDPVELLLNDRLGQLLRLLGRSYDYIYMDCTPVEIVADAAIVSRVADLTVFVARKGLLDRQLLPEVEELHTGDKLNNMAILLNCSHHVRRYGHYYQN